MQLKQQKHKSTRYGAIWSGLALKNISMNTSKVEKNVILIWNEKVWKKGNSNLTSTYNCFDEWDIPGIGWGKAEHVEYGY